MHQNKENLSEHTDLTAAPGNADNDIHSSYSSRTEPTIRRKQTYAINPLTTISAINPPSTEIYLPNNSDASDFTRVTRVKEQRLSKRIKKSSMRRWLVVLVRPNHNSCHAIYSPSTKRLPQTSSDHRFDPRSGCLLFVSTTTTSNISSKKYTLLFL